MAKWYILHVVSGSENVIREKIEQQASRQKMSDLFEQIVVPVIEVPEIKRGKKVLSEKKLIPGYILIKMEMTDDSWHLVKSVTKTKDFLGSKIKPEILDEREVEKIFKRLEIESKSAGISALYNIGDKIQVIDGPFDSFAGIVEEVNTENQRLKISVSIFGKATPIDLSFNQVKEDSS